MILEIALMSTDVSLSIVVNLYYFPTEAEMMS